MPQTPVYRVARDVIYGRSFTDSVNRVPACIIKGVEDIVFQSPPAKRQRTPQHRRGRRRRRQRHRDIFV